MVSSIHYYILLLLLIARLVLMTQQKKCTILCFIMVSRKNLIKNIEWERRHLLALGVSPAISAAQPKKMGPLYGIFFKHLIGLQSFRKSGLDIAGSFGYLGFTVQTIPQKKMWVCTILFQVAWYLNQSYFYFIQSEVVYMKTLCQVRNIKFHVESSPFS